MKAITNKTNLEHINFYLRKSITSKGRLGFNWA